MIIRFWFDFIREFKSNLTMDEIISQIILCLIMTVIEKCVNSQYKNKKSRHPHNIVINQYQECVFNTFDSRPYA